MPKELRTIKNLEIKPENKTTVPVFRIKDAKARRNAVCCDFAASHERPAPILKYTVRCWTTERNGGKRDEVDRRERSPRACAPTAQLISKFKPKDDGEINRSMLPSQTIVTGSRLPLPGGLAAFEENKLEVMMTHFGCTSTLFTSGSPSLYRQQS